MPECDPTRWCPSCSQSTVAGMLPQLASDQDMHLHLEPGDPEAFRQRWYCTECQLIWETMTLPTEFVNELLEARQALEAAKSQLAMLRLLRANDKGAGSDVEETRSLPLRRAG